MLTKTCFDRCMNALLTFAEVPVDKEKNKVFYALMKNDFEDAEFSSISGDICKTELLYGRYPAPKLFYDRKGQKGQTVLIREGTFYIDSGEGYLPMFKDKIDSMSEKSKERCLLWFLNNKCGEEVELSFIEKMLDKFYQPKYQDNSVEYASNISGLISGAVKSLTYDEEAQ